MKVKIPQQNALVVVCGPSCSGKTTLSQKIIQMVPHENKYLFSTDAEKLAIMDRTPDMRCWRQEVMYNPYVTQSDLPERVLQQLIQATGDRLIEVIKTYPFLIYDSVFVETNLLRRHLMAMLALSGPEQPVVLIKILPDDEIFEQFYRQREAKHQLCLPIKTVLLQRYMFLRQILTHNFWDDFRCDDVRAIDRLRMACWQERPQRYSTASEDGMFRRFCSWRGKMYEYAVTDPREVKVEMM